MIKREFKVNLKSFLIWLSVLVVLFLITYIIYPFILNDETMKSMEEIMDMFPPELMKAFNMDMSSISTAYGWFKSEGFMYVLLIIGLYSAILGSNILLKEENDKTIEYLGTLPIKRSKIVTNKIIVGFTYILAMTLALGLFNFVALSISGDFNRVQFILLSITPIFVAFPLFAINLFLSIFQHNTKKTIAISLGMVFVFYLLNMLSELSKNVEFLKYFSVYSLADVRNVISNIGINPICVIISLVLTSGLVLFSYINYNKKELL